MYKVVIVGCGRIAGRYDKPHKISRIYSHASGYANDGRFELSGCVDKEEKVAACFAKLHTVQKSGSNIVSMLDSIKPNVVSVATPVDTHLAVVQEVLNNKNSKPDIIFLEKPVCGNRNELNELIRLSKENSVPIMVNHSRRFHPLYIALQERYAKGEFGKLIGIDSTYYGGWLNSAVHLVDILRFLFTMELHDLEVLDILQGRTDADPTLTVRARCGPESVPVWFRGWNEEYYQIFDLEIRFSKGRLRLSNFEQQWSWDSVVVNSRGEKVLSPGVTDLPQQTDSPIINAIDLMNYYLDTRDVEVLSGKLIQDCELTMHAMWSVGSVYGG